MKEIVCRQVLLTKSCAYITYQFEEGILIEKYESE